MSSGYYTPLPGTKAAADYRTLKPDIDLVNIDSDEMRYLHDFDSQRSIQASIAGALGGKAKNPLKGFGSNKERARQAGLMGVEARRRIRVELKGKP